MADHPTESRGGVCNSLRTPVIFITFNRPEQTSRVLGAIRAARPKVLFLLSDGPRSEVEHDAPKVRSVRAILDGGIDWPCQVHRRYLNANAGCGVAVSTGISWAFTIVDRAIILEDDCLPDPTFFSFCEEMLDKYNQHHSVWAVSGASFLPKTITNSYYFSENCHIWGWATWRRAWMRYDFEMPHWANLIRSSKHWSMYRKLYFYVLFKLAQETKFTWDVQWTYSIMRGGGLVVVPNVNLIENLGFNPDATNTSTSNSGIERAPASMVYPLKYTDITSADPLIDDFVIRLFGGSIWKLLARAVLLTAVGGAKYIRITRAIKCKCAR